MTSNQSNSQMPVLFYDILPRKKIEKILEEAPLFETICMVAPYGCGKTLATLSWVKNHNRQALWLTLDGEINNSSFRSCLAAACLPYVKRQTDIEFFSEPQVTAISTHDYLQRIASLAVNGHICADTLVIDNFHLVTDESLLNEIKDFVHSLLGHLRIILMSRAELSPIYNDLILKRHICMISMKDLSFSLEEMTEYFSMNRHSAQQQDLAQLYNETEGWPAALNVILTITREGPIKYSEDARFYIKGFFETEIWRNLDDNTKDFLMRSSILQVLNPSSCHAVSGLGATQPMLNWLFQNGLFISKLSEKNTYRFHSVFREYLLEKLYSSDIDEKQLNKNAAWWLYEKGEIEQSFPCFYKAEDLYGLNLVLKILNPSNMDMDAYLHLMDCLIDLKIDDLKPYPIILARIALIHYLKGNIHEMQTLYEIFQEWTRPGALPITPEEYAEYLWEAGWLCYINPAEEVRNNNKHEEWTNYKEYVPHLKELHRARGAVLRFPSILRGIRDYSTIVDIVEPYLRQIDKTGQSSVREEVSIWEMNLILAEYAYEIEDYKKSEEIVRRIMILAEKDQMTDLYFVGTALLVKLLRARNTPKEIESLSNRLEEMISSRHQEYLLPNFHAFQLRNKLADGYIGFTETFKQENRSFIDKPHYYLLYRQFTLVRGLLSSGDYNEALLIMGYLDILCQDYRRTMDMIELNILKAIALYHLSNEDDSRNHLLTAIRAAGKYGYIRIFSDEAKEIWPILELVNRQMNDTFVRTIIISCKKTLARSGIKLHQNNDGLTKTELRILKALNLNLSYEEIALDHNIKISTVKSHAHSIYSKLQVENRLAAIMAAQKSGILK